MITIPITGCKSCPFLFSNSEYPERICKALGKQLPVNTRSPYGGEPTPSWCPARNGVIVKLTF